MTHEYSWFQTSGEELTIQHGCSRKVLRLSDLTKWRRRTDRAYKGFTLANPRLRVRSYSMICRGYVKVDALLWRNNFRIVLIVHERRRDAKVS